MGDAGSGVCRLSSRSPASVSPAPAVWLPVSKAAVCAGVRPQASRVFSWLPQTPRLAAGRSPLCPSAVESSPPHSCWFRQKQPLVFPPTQPTALRLQVAVSSAPSTARPGMLLGRRVPCVTSVNSMRPSLLLPGASCSPVHLCPQSPAPSGGAGPVVPALLCLRPGWGLAVDFQSLPAASSRFPEGKLPLSAPTLFPLSRC